VIDRKKKNRFGVERQMFEVDKYPQIRGTAELHYSALDWKGRNGALAAEPKAFHKFYFEIAILDFLQYTYGVSNPANRITPATSATTNESTIVGNAQQGRYAK
jgi:hypothetical protein